MENIIKFFTGTVLTTVIYFLGGWDIALQMLLFMIALDYITGILKSIFNKQLNSGIGLKGIIKKVGFLIIVTMSVMLDNITGDTGAIRTIVIYFFVANEGISIMENWAEMGLPIPKIIKETLEQLKKKEGKEDYE